MMGKFSNLPVEKKDQAIQEILGKVSQLLREKDVSISIDQRKGLMSSTLNGWKNNEFNGSQSFVLRFDINGGANS